MSAAVAIAVAMAVVEADQAMRSRLSMQLGDRAASFSTVESLAELLSGTPVVVVFGPSCADESGLGAIERVTTDHPEVGAILVTSQASTEVFRHAIRAGVKDVLGVPVETPQLLESVRRVAGGLSVQGPRSEHGEPAEAGRVITVFSTKGGAGKSVIAANLAVVLARRSLRPVVLVDAHLQFGDIAVMLKLAPRHTIVDAIGALDRLAALLQNLLVRHDASGVLVLPAPLEPAFADQIGAREMHHVIELLRGSAAYVIVDTPADLTAALRPYSESSHGDEGERQGQAQTALIQRAVELTEQFAERQGFLTKVEGALERANLPLRAAEAIFFYAASVAVLTALVLVTARNLVVTLIAFTVLALLPPAVLNQLAARRQKQFRAQLPDMLQLLAGTLRAGYSMMQGVEAVSQECAEPMGRELRRVVTEARLGRPLEDALDGVAKRMGSRDFAWAVMAIRIQREVGGNLSELLMTVADTMTQRERLRRDIRALTAEGRMSAIVLGVLTPGLALVMLSINPRLHPGALR